MTREEIIDFCDMKAQLEPENEDIFKSIINALEQNDVLDEIRAEIKGWQDDIHDNENDADEHDFVFERIFEIFDEYRESEVEE